MDSTVTRVRPTDYEIPRELYERDSVIREAWRELRELRRYRELTRYMMSSSLRLEHAGTILGAIWWLLDPLLLMIVYVLFVDVILQRGGNDYALFVLIAVIAWKHFSSACGRAMGNTVQREGLLRQVKFPRSVVPLAAVLAVTFHFLLGIALLFAVAAGFGNYPTPVSPAVFIVAGVQLTFTLGLAFLLAGVNFFFRDVQPLMAYIFLNWFYLSPGLYSIDEVPKRFRHVIELNPFTPILESYRTIIMAGELPPFRPLLIVFGVAVVLLVLGYLAFVRLQYTFTKLS